MKENGAFRFTYFTELYHETTKFYTKKLAFKVLHSWNGNENDKGILLKAGVGTIEVLLAPDNTHKIQGLDYRKPQGVFACLQVKKARALYEKYQGKGVEFKENLVDQTWGHRSFSVIDPNGIVLFFFEEIF